ncbi:class I SAM-dependent methyltransferase [Bryobacter aggregatus]|uniref:class I SAM-dependent methyltransferase n=1 Tax=Bryobacter aggregatus TaxID=360054 RepID=UPI00068C1D4E|nr:class I SAM-dependent methyltransferase [Bryobacter aggregatus]
MNANPIAVVYRFIEYLAFGTRLERCREKYLFVTTQARRILILGEGDGRFLQQLVAINPTGQIDVIESSEMMVQLAMGRLPVEAHSRVHFYQRDVLPIPDQHYDLVVTHFFLDCFEPQSVQRIIAAIETQLSPGALWLLSEFQQPPSGFRALHAQLWLRTMYLFFQKTTGLGIAALPPYATLLRAAGLRQIAVSDQFLSLITAQLWIKPS